MSHINPTPQQIEALAQISDEGPFVMVNLLRFKPDGGAEKYDEYSRRAAPVFERIGGRLVYYGKGVMTFIGDDAWDGVLLAEYPSRTAFVSMLSDPEYREAVSCREESLIDSRLYITKSIF